MKEKNSNRSIVIVLRKTSQEKTDRVLDLLRQVYVPKGFDLQLTIEEGSRAKAYNSGMQKVEADIRFFIDDSIANLDQDIFVALSRHFESVPNLGLLGLIGSEIPIDGDLQNAKSLYGSYIQLDGDDSYSVLTKNAIFEQNVQAVDGSFIGLRGDVDVKFDGAAMCIKVKQKGFLTVVPMQSEPLACFDSPCVYMKDESTEDEYDHQRQRFRNSYEMDYLPLVSILIPAYNQPEYFRQAIDSAIKQDYPNVEILIGDDSDNDEVQKIAEQYMRSYRHVKYDRHGKSLGVHGWKNMHKLLQDSHGEFVQFLLHDDLIYPSKISRMMEVFQSDLNDEIAFVTSSRDNIDAEGNKTDRPRSPFVPAGDEILSSKLVGQKIMTWGSNFIGELTTVLIRKSDLWQESLNEYRVGYYYGVQDRSMWDVSTFLELGRKNANVIFIQDCLSAYRSHSRQNLADPQMRVTLVLDWISLIFLSYGNRSFFENAESFKFALSDYLFVVRYNLLPDITDSMNSPEFDRYRRIQTAFDNDDLNAVVPEILDYIRENTIDSNASRDLTPIGKIF